MTIPVNYRDGTRTPHAKRRAIERRRVRQLNARKRWRVMR